MELTGETISEIGQRIVAKEPRAAFSHSTLMAKVVPNGSRGTLCRRQFWTKNIGTGVSVQIGTRRQIIVAPHHVSRDWCLTHADLESGKLHYHDPLYHGPNQTRALGALGAYIDQVHCEQGRVKPQEQPPSGAFPAELHIYPRQRGCSSCGVCVLIETQRIVDGGVDAPREEMFAEAELLRFRAK